MLPGGSWKLAVALLGVRTPSENLAPVSQMQAYIAYLIQRILSIAECCWTQSATEHIRTCGNVLYILTGKGNTVGVRSCLSSSVMGLAPNSERQGGERLELA